MASPAARRLVGDAVRRRPPDRLLSEGGEGGEVLAPLVEVETARDDFRGGFKRCRQRRMAKSSWFTGASSISKWPVQLSVASGEASPASRSPPPAAASGRASDF
jgi:hypothetical protein